MEAKTNQRESYTGHARSVTIYALRENKRPVGFAPWPQEEEPEPKKKRKRKQRDV